jgi:hypothetical protein
MRQAQQGPDLQQERPSHATGSDQDRSPPISGLSNLALLVNAITIFVLNRSHPGVLEGGVSLRDPRQLQALAAQSAGQPVFSVDTKKKELIGNFKSGGTDCRPKGDPLDVNEHDFKDKELGKVVPHGVYDPTTHAGWVSVVEHVPTGAGDVSYLERTQGVRRNSDVGGAWLVGSILRRRK